MATQPEQRPRYYAKEILALVDRALARVPAHLRNETTSHMVAELSRRNHQAALGKRAK